MPHPPISQLAGRKSGVRREMAQERADDDHNRYLSTLFVPHIASVLHLCQHKGRLTSVKHCDRTQTHRTREIDCCSPLSKTTVPGETTTEFLRQDLVRIMAFQWRHGGGARLRRSRPCPQSPYPCRRLACFQMSITCVPACRLRATIYCRHRPTSPATRRRGGA